MECPVCSHKVSKFFNVDLHICEKCLHIFKSIKVSDNSYHNYLSSAHSMVGTEKERLGRYASRYRFNYVKNYKTSGDLLEIGIGHKYFMEHAKNNGFNVSGTELSKALIRELPDYKIHYGNPSSLELEMYDVIAMFHVLEHMNEPLKEVKTLVKHLREDGIVVIEIPTLVLHGMNVNIADVYEHLHTQYFNQFSIVEFLKNVGLKPIYQVNFWDIPTRENSLIVCCKEGQFDKFYKPTFKLVSGVDEL